MEELLGGAFGFGELGHDIGQDDGARAGATGFLDEAHAPDGVDIVNGVDDESHITLLNDIPQHGRGADDLYAGDARSLFGRAVIQYPHYRKRTGKIGPMEHPECHFAIIPGANDEDALGDGFGMVTGTDPARGCPGDETIAVTDADEADEAEDAGGEDDPDREDGLLEEVDFDQYEQHGADSN